MPCQQRFVRCDDRLALLKRGENHLTCRGGAANQLDDKIDIRIVNDAVPVISQQRFGNFDGALLVHIAHRHPKYIQAHAQPRGHQSPIPLNGLEDATAHGAAPNNAQIHLLHRSGELAGKGGSGQYDFGHLKLEAAGFHRDFIRQGRVWLEVRSSGYGRSLRKSSVTDFPMLCPAPVSEGHRKSPASQPNAVRLTILPAR